MEEGFEGMRRALCRSRGGGKKSYRSMDPRLVPSGGKFVGGDIPIVNDLDVGGREYENSSDLDVVVVEIVSPVAEREWVLCAY